MIQKFVDYLNEKYPEGIFGYGPYWLLTHPWIVIPKIKHNMKWAWQRVFRGWDDTAVYSMDYYLATIIPQMVRELKDKKQGVPGPIIYQEDFDHSLYEIPDDVINRAEERWNNILDEIVVGFELYKKAQDNGLPPESIKVKYEKAWDNLREYFQNLWW